MTEKMIMMWHDLMGSMVHSIDENLVKFALFDDLSLITAESFIEHMLLEFCKHAYHEKAPKHPLRYYLPYDFADNKERMVYSRTMKYTQQYKDYNYRVMEIAGQHPEMFPELKAKPMDTISDRKEGYELSEMDFFEANTIHDLGIVKSIAENRIYSSKKVSNTRFEELFGEYDDWVQELIERSKRSDEDMVFASIAFFTFEWKYAIEYYYILSGHMIENSIESIDFYTTWLFTGTYHYDSMIGINVGVDSRMIKDRIDLIPVFYNVYTAPYTMELLKRKFIETQTIKALMMDLPCTEGGKYVDWFTNNVAMKDIASFFRDYDVFQIWHKKSFDNIKIKMLRYVLETSSTFNKRKE